MNNQMIPLTVANTLDQSVKQRIEARGQQTVKQAVQEAKMAPQGQFDVFDGLGKVVSNQPVDQFRDKTIYIGVQKVAGGAPEQAFECSYPGCNSSFPEEYRLDQHISDRHTESESCGNSCSCRDCSEQCDTVIIEQVVRLKPPRQSSDRIVSLAGRCLRDPESCSMDENQSLAGSIVSVSQGNGTGCSCGNAAASDCEWGRCGNCCNQECSRHS